MSPNALAALIGGGFGVFSLLVNISVTLTMNGERLSADRKALERRGALDRELAEKKAALDRRLALDRRKAEVAELILTDFYEAQRTYEIVRSPMVWAHEMVPEEGVEDDVVRNAGYGVIRRLRGYNEFFSRLEARRFTAAALFGPGVLARFDDITRVHNRIVAAAQYIMEAETNGRAGEDRDYLVAQRKIAFSPGRDDEVAANIQTIINALEAVCRPVIETAEAEY